MIIRVSIALIGAMYFVFAVPAQATPTPPCRTLSYDTAVVPTASGTLGSLVGQPLHFDTTYCVPATADASISATQHAFLYQDAAVTHHLSIGGFSWEFDRISITQRDPLGPADSITFTTEGDAVLGPDRFATIAGAGGGASPFGLAFFELTIEGENLFTALTDLPLSDAGWTVTATTVFGLNATDFLLTTAGTAVLTEFVPPDPEPPVAMPVPGSLPLLASGLIGLGFISRRQGRKIV